MEALSNHESRIVTSVGITHEGTNLSVTYSETNLPESQIADFCKPCQLRNPDNTCKIDTHEGNDQGRYVVRNWCGWAMVNGTRGQMTNEGFKPFE